MRASSSGRCGRVTQAQKKEDKMATRSKHRPTAEQRDARRREQLEQLRQATSALLTSEGWKRWIRTRSLFHRYSLRNTVLIAFQCPHATHVAGFRRWLELGRCVRKGEKAIRIFAPIRYRRGEPEQTDDGKSEPQLVGFRLAAVFDTLSRARRERAERRRAAFDRRRAHRDVRRSEAALGRRSDPEGREGGPTPGGMAAASPVWLVPARPAPPIVARLRRAYGGRRRPARGGPGQRRPSCVTTSSATRSATSAARRIGSDCARQANSCSHPTGGSAGCERARATVWRGIR